MKPAMDNNEAKKIKQGNKNKLKLAPGTVEEEFTTLASRAPKRMVVIDGNNFVKPHCHDDPISMAGMTKNTKPGASLETSLQLNTDTVTPPPPSPLDRARNGSHGNDDDNGVAADLPGTTDTSDLESGNSPAQRIEEGMPTLEAYLPGKKKKKTKWNGNDDEVGMSPAILEVVGVVEEVSKKREKNSNNACSVQSALVFVFWSFIAIALIVGLSVGLDSEASRNADNSSSKTAENTPGTESPTQPFSWTSSPSHVPSVPPTTTKPTLAPTPAPTSESFAKVAAQLEVEFPNQVPLDDNGSTPGRQAVQWMADQDLFDLPLPANATLERIMFRQRYAMATFFFSTSVASDTMTSSWDDDCNFLSRDHICNWTCPLPLSVLEIENVLVRRLTYGLFFGDGLHMGVFCFDGPEGVLASGIQLPSNGLTGTIPKELAAMNFPGINFFITLSLAGNDLTGTIPFEHFGTNGLVSLWLAHNQLTGAIPSIAPSSVLRNVIALNLSFNQMSGPLPPNMTDMTSLQSLYLHDNLLTGSIEASRVLYMTNHAYIIDLGTNRFNGTIPDITSGTEGDDREMMNEATSGNVLGLLVLERNLLSGTIPSTISNLAPDSLNQLKLGVNKLIGTLPSSIVDLAALEVLDVADNMLTGTLPDSLGRMTNARIFDLGGNQFTGSPLQHEDNYGLFHTMTSLEGLRLEKNNFNGRIDISTNWTESLTSFHFGVNNFSGTLPTEIGLLTSLAHMSLNVNMDLTGMIPTEIGLLTNLQGLWIYGTQLSGSLNELCDNKVDGFNFGYIADCLEGGGGGGDGGDHTGVGTGSGGVLCSCCVECCDKSKVGNVITPETDFDDYCEAV